MRIQDSRPRRGWLLLAVLLPCLCLAGCAARGSRSLAADRAVADSPTPVPTFTPVPTSSPTFTPTSTPTPTLLPTPTPSLTQTGTFDFPAVHTDSRYELQLTGTRVLAVFATSGSPVEYWARAVWLPLFTVPEPFRPPNPIFRMVEGQPVHADGTPDTARTAPHYVLLRVDPDGTVHYVDDARVEGAGRLAYALHMAWVTAPVAVESVPSEVPEPAPSLTVSGTYNNLVEHEDGRYELQLAGTRVVANLFTSRSPVQYRAREVATPLFTVPVPFRPPYPILRTAEGIPVRNDSTLASDLPELRRFLLRVDTDGSVHYVDDTRVEGKDRQAYCLNLVGLTGVGIATGTLRAPAGGPQPPPPTNCADSPERADRYLAYSLDTVWGTTPGANDRAVLEILDRHWFRKTLLSAEPPPVQFEVPALKIIGSAEIPAASLGAFVTFDADGRVTALGAPMRAVGPYAESPGYHFHGPLLPELGQLHRLEHLDLGYRDHEFTPSGPSRRQTGASYVGRSLSIPAGTGALAGTIPPQLWQLSRLRYLDLQGQLLTEPLPPEMGGLSALEHLDLGSNWLAGPLPAELGQLVRLRTLNLSVNRLTALPSELGQLTALQVLDLSGNQLTGLPPELGQLANLQTLNLGPQPWEVAVFVSSGGLGLYGNRLTGLPPELGRLANLQALDLSGNRLTGLPPELGRLANLQALDLSGNRLTGLPSMLGQLTHLEHLVLSQNQLAGSLPSIWGQLIHLRTLDLRYNQLTGPLPPEWGQLANLEHLYLSDNQLAGSLPSAWGRLIHLRTLYLSDNRLTGPLPPEWGQLANLEHLYLSDNQLAGSLPSAWGRLTSLEGLRLANNQLTGPLPLEWSRLTSLTNLRLSGNQLTGCYPQIYFPHLPSGGGALYHPPYIQTDLPDCPPPDYIYHDSRGKG